MTSVVLAVSRAPASATRLFVGDVVMYYRPFVLFINFYTSTWRSWQVPEHNRPIRSIG